MAVRTITVRVTGDVAQFERAMRSVGIQIATVERQAASSINVFRQMRGGMTALAQEAVGRTVPGLASLAGVLGSFALGSTVTVGVLAGVAAVAAAIRVMGKEAREAANETKEAIERLEELARKRRDPKGVIQADIDRAVAEGNQLRRLLDLRAAGQVGSFREFGGLALLSTETLRERFLNVIRITREGEGEITDIIVEESDRRTRELKRAAEERARIMEEAAAIIRRMTFGGIIPIKQPFQTDPFLQPGAFPSPIGRGARPILGGSQQEGAIMRGRPRTAEQLEEEARRLELAAQSMAQSVATAFEAWVTGAQKAKDAVRDMVSSILRDLLRLVAQRAIVEPLAGVFLNALGGSSVAGGGSRAVVVNQSVNFAISAVDAPGVASLLQQNSGTIAQIVGDAARRSTGFRAQLVGG